MYIYIYLYRLTQGGGRPTGCLIFTSHFPQKTHIIIGSFVEKDLNLRNPMGLATLDWAIAIAKCVLHMWTVCKLHSYWRHMCMCTCFTDVCECASKSAHCNTLQHTVKHSKTLQHTWCCYASCICAYIFAAWSASASDSASASIGLSIQPSETSLWQASSALLIVMIVVYIHTNINMHKYMYMHICISDVITKIHLIGDICAWHSFLLNAPNKILNAHLSAHWSAEIHNFTRTWLPTQYGVVAVSRID